MGGKAERKEDGYDHNYDYDYNLPKLMIENDCDNVVSRVWSVV